MAGLPFILRRSTPLLFPGGVNAAFNTSHLAAPGISCVAVALGGGGRFINLLTGKVASAGGTAASYALDGTIGPCAKFAANGYQSFAGLAQNSLTSKSYTWAAIFRATATSGTTYLCGINNNTGFVIVSGVLELRVTTTNYTSGITITAGVPYFAAVSFTSLTNANCVVCNLNTGAIQTAVIALSVNPNFTGTFYVASYSGLASEFNGSIAAVMQAVFGSSLSIPQLVAWAQDPWSLWYAPAVESLLFFGWLGSFVPSLTVSLTARMVFGFKGYGGPTGQVPLAGRVTTTSKITPATSYTAALSARLTTAAKASSAPTGRAALSGRLSAIAKAVSSLTGTVGLTARATLQQTSRGAVTGTVNLSGRISAAAKATGVAAGVVGLTALARTQFTATAVVSGKVGLSALSAVRFTARGVLSAFTAIVTDPRFISIPRPRLRVTTPKPRRLVTTPRVRGERLPQGPDFSTVDTIEKVTDTFDFAPWLPTGTTIASIIGVTCGVYMGTDAAASSRLVGAASIGPSPSSGATSAAVLQQFGNTPIAGVTYRLDATIVTSDGQTLNLFAHQLCQTPD